MSKCELGENVGLPPLWGRTSLTIHLLSRMISIIFISVVRLGLRDLEKQYEKTEEDIKALQSVGQIIGEVLKQLDEERCE